MSIFAFTGGRFRRLLLALMATGLACGTLQAHYVYNCTRTVPPHPGWSIYFTAINTQGQIAGFSNDTTGVSHGFLLDSKGLETPIVYPGTTTADSTQPFGINNKGVIVGRYTIGSDDHMFVRDASGNYNEVTPPPLGMPPNVAGNFSLDSINDSGEIIGSFNYEDDPPYDTRYSAVLFKVSPTGEKTIISDEEQTPGEEFGPFAGIINNAGYVLEVGGGADTFLDGWLLAPSGARTQLGYPGLDTEAGPPPYTVTSGLNNKNVLTGTFSAFKQGFTQTADGHVTALTCPDLPGASVYPAALNDLGEVVGTITDSSGTSAFFARPTGLAPKVVLSNTSWGFSPHPIGQPSGLGVIYLSNSGNANLQVQTIYVAEDGTSRNFSRNSFSIVSTTCSAETPNDTDLIWGPKVIPEGGWCALRFQFTPTQAGWQTGAIYIVDDAPDSPQVIQLNGTGLK